MAAPREKGGPTGGEPVLAGSGWVGAMPIRSRGMDASRASGERVGVIAVKCWAGKRLDENE